MCDVISQIEINCDNFEFNFTDNPTTLHSRQPFYYKIESIRNKKTKICRISDKESKRSAFQLSQTEAGGLYKMKSPCKFKVTLLKLSPNCVLRMSTNILNINLNVVLCVNDSYLFIDGTAYNTIKKCIKIYAKGRSVVKSVGVSAKTIAVSAIDSAIVEGFTAENVFETIQQSTEATINICTKRGVLIKNKLHVTTPKNKRKKSTADGNKRRRTNNTTSNTANNNNAIYDLTGSEQNQDEIETFECLSESLRNGDITLDRYGDIQNVADHNNNRNNNVTSINNTLNTDSLNNDSNNNTDMFLISRNGMHTSSSGSYSNPRLNGIITNWFNTLNMSRRFSPNRYLHIHNAYANVFDYAPDDYIPQESIDTPCNFAAGEVSKIKPTDLLSREEKEEDRQYKDIQNILNKVETKQELTEHEKEKHNYYLAHIEKEPPCSVCKFRAKSVCINECGHKEICVQCANELIRSKNIKCVVCKTAGRFIKIY